MCLWLNYSGMTCLLIRYSLSMGPSTGAVDQAQLLAWLRKKLAALLTPGNCDTYRCSLPERGRRRLLTEAETSFSPCLRTTSPQPMMCRALLFCGREGYDE